MNKTDIFDNINNLYSEYQFLYEKKLDNYEQYYIAFETEKNNLFHAILKLYCKSDNSDSWDFIDIITETIDSALEKFPEYLKKNQDKKQNELTFSQYVCVKINNCLSKAKSIQIAENNTGGSKITEHEARMIRAIKKDFENLKSFNLTEEDLIEEISLRQGIGKKTVRKYLPLIRNNTKSINDIFLEVTSNSITPENELFVSEVQAGHSKLLPKVLEAMERQHNQNDKMESQVLTVHLLKNFKNDKKAALKNDLDFLKTHKEIYELFKNYHFIDKEILISFFEDINYSLKTDKSIEDENGMEKGSANHKWNRFIEKMKKENPELEY